MAATSLGGELWSDGMFRYEFLRIPTFDVSRLCNASMSRQ